MKLSHAQNNEKTVTVDLEFDKLLDFITTENYSLGVFRDGHRKAANFEYAEAVALDFDGGLSLSSAKEKFAHYKHIIATTRSHQKEKGGIVCDRFRVILFLTTPITDKDVYKATIKQLIFQYPQADAACTDASRQWFKSESIVSQSKKGALIVPAEVEVKETVRTELHKKGQLSLRTNEFILFGAEEGQWNHSLFQAAKDIQEQNYSQDEAEQILELATRNYEGELNEEDLKTIASAFSTDPKHNPRLPETPAINAKPIKELLVNKPKVNWLIDGLLTRGGFSLWVGQPKSGKSTILRQASVDIAQGQDFLGRKVKQGTVTYLAIEEQEEILYEQFRKLGVKEDDPFYLHVGPIYSNDSINSLRNYLTDRHADLVVIDTLLLFDNFDANSYNDVNRTLANVRNIAREFNCHIACIHHQNKSRDYKSKQMQGTESILGSNAIHGAVDCAVMLNKLGRKRTITSSQRGGNAFTGQVISYNTDTERYTIWESADEF